MGNQSIVSGYVIMRMQADMQQTRQTIASYPFDDVYPFSNIFWCDSPHPYGGTPLVGFVGAYKEIEEVWNEWLWKFSRFLSAASV